MSDPTDPSDPFDPDPGVADTEPGLADTEPALAGQGSAQGTATATTGASVASVMDHFDPAGRLVAGGSAAALVILLLGTVAGAWSLSGYTLIILAAAIACLALAWVAAGRPPRLPIPVRDLLLGAAAVLAVLSVLNLLEVLFDLDQLDDERGGIVGLVLTIALAAAAVVVKVGVLQGRSTGDLIKAATQGGDRGTKLAVAAFTLDLIGIILMLTLSVFRLSPGIALGFTAIILATVTLVAIAADGDDWELPFAPAWIAVALAVVGAFTLIDQIGQVGRQNDRAGLDPIDLLAFAAHVLGALGVLIGATWSALERQGLSLPKAPPDAAGDAGAGSGGSGTGDAAG